MKIGIISEFSTHTVNYGNHLQAYALNYYLREYMNVENVESVVLSPKHLWRHTGVLSLRFIQKMFEAVLRRLHITKQETVVLADRFAERMEEFARFRNANIPMSKNGMTTDDLCDAAYDAIVVGSDVVWGQAELGISRTKFLDFEAQKAFKRISYAASFARDYIPKENIRLLRKYLNRFDAISVRERSSVDMLQGIGVQNVSYCLDPTMLLPVSDWEALEKRPQMIEQDEAYIFVYLLGKEQLQRAAIIDYARCNGLKVVTVPHADGVYHEVDELFGDMQVNDCSIENWIWLIHHARYVITDSFHGLVFATILKKQFLVLKRHYTIDINNRIHDFLQEIGQSDKVISEKNLSDVSDMVWDYECIDREINIRRTASINFLNDALEKVRVN